MQDFRILFPSRCFQWVAVSERYDRKAGQLRAIGGSGRSDYPSSLNGTYFPEDMAGTATEPYTLMGAGHPAAGTSREGRLWVDRRHPLQGAPRPTGGPG